jgi:hypothetical protein
MLATDPLIADSPFAAMLFSDPNWTVTYTCRTIDGIEVYCEWSPSLIIPSWGTNGVVEAMLDIDGDIETRTAELQTDTDAKYLRIRIER